MPVIPNDQPQCPHCHVSTVEKKAKRVIIACTEREHKAWLEHFGFSSMSKTLRSLANAAVALKVKQRKDAKK